MKYLLTILGTTVVGALSWIAYENSWLIPKDDEEEEQETTDDKEMKEKEPESTDEDNTDQTIQFEYE